MTQVLVLNGDFSPMQKTTPLKRALRLVCLDRAEIVEAEGFEVKTVDGALPRPSVIRLKKFVHVPRKFRGTVTNTFLYARDNYTCQYCLRKESQLKGRERLNRDHIIPKSRGGGNTWGNCVTACSTCNSRKDNRTPQEAGMKLHCVPTEPHLVHLKWSVRKLTTIQKKHITAFFGQEWLDNIPTR
jgi:5-methylcytosine-specific restriction endonuclease McrA